MYLVLKFINPDQFKTNGRVRSFSVRMMNHYTSSFVRKSKVRKNNELSLGVIKDNHYHKFKGSVEHNQQIDLHFEAKNNLYADIWLYGTNKFLGPFVDDLNFSVIPKSSKKNKQKSLYGSDLRGNDSEHTFAVLEKGDYILRIEHADDLDKSKLPTKFEIEFDTLSFKEESVVPNDPLFTKQWHLHNTGQSGGLQQADINAVQAWKKRTESKDVTVAIIDGGVDLSHPDLSANIWINREEIPGNNIDDDNNGYIDDVNGWNFVANNNKPHPDEHGTHVAGIVGAKGNNGIGTTGVNWNAKLMSLDVFNTNKSYTDEDLIEAIEYAVDNGADVINMSLGYTIPYGNLGLYKSVKPEIYRSYYEAFDSAIGKNVVIVTSAGNDDAEDELHLSLPAAFSTEFEGFISVAAIDHDDSITDYSNFGSEITIAAPGGSTVTKDSQVYSTLPTHKGLYGGMPGTSMAAPVVSGAISLILAENKKLKPWDIESLLNKTAYKSNFLKGFVKEGNSLDVGEALRVAKKYKSSPRKNIISSELGQNVLTGSSGGDLFDFSELVEFGPSGFDNLKFFNSNEGDKLLFSSSKIFTDRSISTKNMNFKVISNTKSLTKSSKSNAEFVYFKPEGQLYLNSNGKKSGWGDSGKGGLILSLDKNTKLSKNDFNFVDKNQQADVESNDNLSVPFDELAYFDFAKHLWKKSGKDKSINFAFESDSFLKVDDDPLLKGSKDFLNQSLKDLQENTSLSFSEVPENKADLLFRSVNKLDLPISETDWGISMSWKFYDLEFDAPYTLKDIGWVFGLKTLEEKTESRYTFNETAMAWDYESKFQGFTSTDYSVIDQVWDSF